jgi:predicted DNA-binding transcriptional regulator AlpA
MKLLTFEEGLRLLTVSPATYYRHPQNLPRAFRIGGRLRFREQDLLNWIDGQAAAAGASPAAPEADEPPRLGDAA